MAKSVRDVVGEVLAAGDAFELNPRERRCRAAAWDRRARLLEVLAELGGSGTMAEIRGASGMGESEAARALQFLVAARDVHVAGVQKFRIYALSVTAAREAHARRLTHAETFHLRIPLAEADRRALAAFRRRGIDPAAMLRQLLREAAEGLE